MRRHSSSIAGYREAVQLLDPPPRAARMASEATTPSRTGLHIVVVHKDSRACIGSVLSRAFHALREDRAMVDTLASPFRSLHFSRVIAAQHSSTLYRPAWSNALERALERAYAKYSSQIIVRLVRWFPTLAEIAGVLKLAYIFGWQSLWWVPTLAFPVATAITIIAYPSSYFRSDPEGSPLLDDASSTKEIREIPGNKA